MEPVLGSVTIVERAAGRYAITGELDLAAASQLYELEAIHEPLFLDLRSVTFIDASGIRALIRLRQRGCPHPHCTVQIEACSPRVERVLRIAGVYDVLTEPPAQEGTDGDGHRGDLRSPVPTMEPGARNLTVSAKRPHPRYRTPPFRPPGQRRLGRCSGNLHGGSRVRDAGGPAPSNGRKVQHVSEAI